MQVINRTSLPELINRDGRRYERINKANAHRDAMQAERKGLRVIQCNVLPTRLKGVTDLHGNLYKPTEWFFVETL